MCILDHAAYFIDAVAGSGTRPKGLSPHIHGIGAVPHGLNRNIGIACRGKQLYAAWCIRFHIDKNLKNRCNEKQ